MDEILMNPIGIIETRYKSLEDMPIQPKGAGHTLATITLDESLESGLTHLDGFSHIYLIYAFHLSEGYSLMVKPFMDNNTHGVFATRAPRRPNPIGLSIVKLLSVDTNRIMVEGADLVDGTPILDIKPYIEPFDKVESSKNGWLDASKDDVKRKKSDARFVEGSL